MIAGALAYLTWHTVVNRLRRQVARLRNPRYAMALLLGVAWIGVVLLQRPAPGNPTHTGGPWVEEIAAFSILLLIAWSWLSSPDARVLMFSPAEVTLLFPAPLTRLTLLHYKLLRTQLVILLNVIIWTAMASPHQTGLPVWLRAASFWVVITTLALHRLAAAMVRSSVTEHGRFGLRRRVISVGLATVAVVALGFGLSDVWPGLVAAVQSGGSHLRDALGAAINHPAIAAVLWPLRALVRPLGATSPTKWMAAMLPAVGILLIHYLWVVRSDIAFEEAAAEASLARARRPAAPTAGAGVIRARSGNVSPALFPLSPTGRPGTAILWKSLAAVLRRRRALQIGLVLVVLGSIVATATQGPWSTVAEVTGTLALTWLGFLVVGGPQWVRNDLRGDLPKVDLLRSYPLRGRTIVAMEASASAVVLTLLELALAALAFLAFLNIDVPEIGPQDRGLLFNAVVLLLPPLNFMAMLLQNGAAVLFPGWVRAGAPATGVEALGQQLLSVTALWLVLGLTLVAPVALATITFKGLESTFRVWAVASAFAVALGALTVEALLLLRWLGAVFERGES
jgi:Putative ABC exporter